MAGIIQFQKSQAFTEIEAKDVKDGSGKIRLIGIIVARHDLPEEGSTTLAIDDGTGRASILAPIEIEARENDKAAVVGVVFTLADGTVAVKGESITRLDGGIPSVELRRKVKALWDAEFNDKAKEL